MVKFQTPLISIYITTRAWAPKKRYVYIDKLVYIDLINLEFHFTYVV
jgi:hypothetical protein